MKRLYYLTRRIDSVAKISDDLHEAGITDWNFHVLSKSDGRLQRRQIHSANIIQKSDVIHGAERGAMLGFIVGVVTLLILIAMNVNNGFVYLFSLAFCTLFGTWLGGFIGFQKENYKTVRFHDAIEQGQHLIMVDIAGPQERHVRRIMRTQHPEAKLVVEDSSMIYPFEKPQPIS